MNAADRRIIHQLAADWGLSSESIGEGRDRHIVLGYVEEKTEENIEKPEKKIKKVKEVEETKETEEVKEPEEIAEEE
jgi:hypothetical protein